MQDFKKVTTFDGLLFPRKGGPKMKKKRFSEEKTIEILEVHEEAATVVLVR